MRLKIVFHGLLFLFLVMSKNAFAVDAIIEERANTIRALSVMQCAAVTSAVAASLLEPLNITVFIPYIGFVCGAADLVSAVYFSLHDRDKNKSINPYLIFGSIEIIMGTCCFLRESFGWLGTVALVYCGAERYCMASLLAERRYVAPF